MAAASSLPPQSSDAQRNRRGLLWITGAKAFFIASSYGTQLVLPRLLGTVADFGLFATAMNVVSILNNVLIASTLQSVSKFVSGAEDHASAILRQSLRWQALLSLAIGGALWALAPWLSSRVLLDPKLSTMLRIASVVVGSYAIYASAIGYLNGRRRFRAQAQFDIGFSTLRTLGILGAAALGFGATGAFTGLAASAFLIMLSSVLYVGLGRPGEAPQLRSWLAFAAPLAFYQICLNGVLQLDLAVAKRVVAEIALERGSAPEAAARLASQYAGYYRAAQTFAFIPYQLINSVTFIVFPAVARVAALGDVKQARDTVRAAMRGSLLALLAIAAPVAGASSGVMRLAYPEVYVASAPALSVLIFGIVAFSLFAIASTLLNGLGRPLLSATVAAIASALVVFADTAALRWGPLSEERSLASLALATSLGMLFALVLAGGVLYRTTSAFLPWRTLLRASVATLLAYFSAHLLPHGRPLQALLALALAEGVFLGSLWLLGEAEVHERRVLSSFWQKLRARSPRPPG